jgi:putative flippase GtrA
VVSEGTPRRTRREPLRKLFLRFANFWAVRSLLVGGVAGIVDATCLSAGVKVLHLPPVPCGVAGVMIGASLAFVLNKYFSFRDHGAGGPQAVRYAVVFGGELALWAGLNWFLIYQVGLPGLVARAASWAHLTALLGTVDLRILAPKFASDFVVFNIIHLFMLRYVVFPLGRKAQGLAPALAAPQATAASVSLPTPR